MEFIFLNFLKPRIHSKTCLCKMASNEEYVISRDAVERDSGAQPPLLE